MIEKQGDVASEESGLDDRYQRLDRKNRLAVDFLLGRGLDCEKEVRAAKGSGGSDYDPVKLCEYLSGRTEDGWQREIDIAVEAAKIIIDGE